jgi:hypothetical protein
VTVPSVDAAVARVWLFLLDLGVVVPDDLTRDNTPSVATAHLTAEGDTTLGTAHAALAARTRTARVVTTAPFGGSAG